MPRPVRINLPNLIYHVVNRGNNRQVVFAEESDYHKYLDILRRYKTEFEFKIFAYCLMSNHIHLLLKTSGINGVRTRQPSVITMVTNKIIDMERKFAKLYVCLVR
jgi:REP element-mobilizing transposase RayT